MGDPQHGPFKIILTELEPSGPDVLGNPAMDQASHELARLFNLDQQMAMNIVGAVPIVIVDGLSGRVAGIVRDRLEPVRRAGLHMTTTDDPADTIPRVNWPELPAIAQIAEERSSPQRAALPDGLMLCPSCGAGFHLVPSGAHPGHQHGGTAIQPAVSAGARSTAPPPPPAHAPRAQSAAAADDDWMNPPVAKVATAPAPVPAPVRSPAPTPGSGRLDNAALLTARHAETNARPPAERTAPPPVPGGLQVDFTDSGVQDLALPDEEELPPVRSTSSVSQDPFDMPTGDPFDNDAPDPFDRVEEDPFSADDLPAPKPEFNGSGSSFEATGSLEDSGSDLLDLDTPNRTSGYDDFVDPPPRGRQSPSLDSLDNLSLLEDSGDLGMADLGVEDRSKSRASRSRFDSDDGLDILEDSVAPSASASAGGLPDLDEVLDMFGPEDEQPLDDMSGLEPKPLDLSPAGRRSSRGGGDPFDDELSDILEPLNPSEAMEIIKSQKGRSHSPAGRGSKRIEALDDDDSLDVFSDPPPKRSRKKKTRGVPFSASDEDLALFEESHGGGSGGANTRARSKTRSSSSKAKKKRTDPFARARRAIEEEEASGTTGKRNGRSRKSKSSRRAKSKSKARRSVGGGGGAAPKGDGDHGLVLSRISDPDKKEKAAELIAEIKGCSVDSANRLTDRTIIPVLKGVSRDVAEFHLDKFKRFKIAGRVTTRQRS